MRVGQGGGSPSPFPAAAGVTGRIPNPPGPTPGGGGMLRMGGHPPQADPCGVVGGVVLEVRGTAVFHPGVCLPCLCLSFPIRAHTSVFPLRRKDPHPCPARPPAFCPEIPRAPEPYLSTHIHSSRCSSSGRDSAVVSSLRWGLSPVSSPALQSPNKQPNPKLDGLRGLCHGDPQAASAPRGRERGHGQRGPAAVSVPQAGHFSWGEDPALVLWGSRVLLLAGVSVEVRGCWEEWRPAARSPSLPSPSHSAGPAGRRGERPAPAPRGLHLSR